MAGDSSNESVSAGGGGENAASRPAEYLSHLGEPFVPVVIMRDGITCRFCQRVIRVREKAASFKGGKEHECRDCMYDAPINDYNRWWRTRNVTRPSSSERPPGRWDLDLDR